jgi:hypothetical protein
MVMVHPEFLVNEKNEKRAVVLPVDEWQQILEALEELEDIRAYDEAKTLPSDPIPFDEALKMMERGGEV